MGDILTYGEISAIVRPLLVQYGLRGASVFGSYARGEATSSSDIDLLIDILTVRRCVKKHSDSITTAIPELFIDIIGCLLHTCRYLLPV